MKTIKPFFECTAAERRGYLVLSLLILLLLAVRLCLLLLPPAPLPPLDESQMQLYCEFEARQHFLADSLDSVREARRLHYEINRTRRYRPESWKRKYEYPAPFRQEGEETAHIPFTRRFPEKISPTAAKVELNRADTLLLQCIPGFGSRMAREIVAYRERLGGYSAIGQLLEVRFMDSARWQKVLPYLTLDTCGMLRKLNINTAGVGELMRHPYIDYYLAKTIVVRRENKGAYRSLEEMRSATGLYPELYEQLKPYLTTK